MTKGLPGGRPFPFGAVLPFRAGEVSKGPRPCPRPPGNAGRGWPEPRCAGPCRQAPGCFPHAWGGWPRPVPVLFQRLRAAGGRRPPPRDSCCPGQAQALAAVPPFVGRDGELVARPVISVLSGPFVLPGPAVFLPGFRRFGDERGDAQRRCGQLSLEVFQGDGIGQDRAQVAALFLYFPGDPHTGSLMVRLRRADAAARRRGAVPLPVPRRPRAGGRRVRRGRRNIPDP